MAAPPFDPLDLADALHPDEGATPLQPPEPLGATAAGEATAGTPPFVLRRLSIPEWDAYIAAYVFAWRPPRWIVLHHTWRPTAATWRGEASMRAMQRYYAGLGWTSAPHLYVAPDGIWLATPLSRIGIHAGAQNGSVAQGWYSIGLEMVGDFDREPPSGPVWAGARAVLRGIARRVGRDPAAMLTFHRDSSSKSCPGWAVTREWVLAELAAAAAPPQAPPLTTPDSLLLGPPSGPAAAAIVYLSARATQYDPGAIATIVDAYRREGEAHGLDWFLALAQLAHETGCLTSWWCARPQRNPAGLGVTGETRPGQLPQPGPDWAHDGRVWRRGLSFACWDPDAVRAHLGRLLAYALPTGRGTPAQQALLAEALALRPLPASYRGVARTLRGLQGTWAVPGATYARRIADHANRMRGGA